MLEQDEQLLEYFTSIIEGKLTQPSDWKYTPEEYVKAALASTAVELTNIYREADPRMEECVFVLFVDNRPEGMTDDHVLFETTVVFTTESGDRESVVTGTISGLGDIEFDDFVRAIMDSVIQLLPGLFSDADTEQSDKNAVIEQVFTQALDRIYPPLAAIFYSMGFSGLTFTTEERPYWDSDARLAAEMGCPIPGLEQFTIYGYFDRVATTQPDIHDTPHVVH